MLIPHLSPHLKGKRGEGREFESQLNDVMKRYLYPNNTGNTSDENNNNGTGPVEGDKSDYLNVIGPRDNVLSGGSKEDDMLAFLMNIFKAKTNIKTLATGEPPEIIFEPISYDKMTPDAWESLNNNKPLHFYNHLKETNYTMSGGSISLSNPLGREKVVDYSKRCYKVEILYHKKHYEYLKLFTILYDLFKLARKLTTANQSLLKTKVYDKDGNVVPVNNIFINLPKDIINIEKAMVDQKKALDYTQEFMKKSEEGQRRASINSTSGNEFGNNFNNDAVPYKDDTRKSAPKGRLAGLAGLAAGTKKLFGFGKSPTKAPPRGKVDKVQPDSFDNTFGLITDQDGGKKSKKNSLRKRAPKKHSKKVKRDNRNKQCGGENSGDTLSARDHELVLGLEPMVDSNKKRLNRDFKILQSGFSKIKPMDIMFIEDKTVTKTKDKIKFYDKQIKELDNVLIGDNRKLKFQDGGGTITDPKELQKLLDKCYNLEQLYAMKHYEVMEIMKPIIYYYNAIAVELILMMFILDLYNRGEMVDDDEFEELFKLKVKHEGFLDSVDELLETQKDISKVIKNLHKDGENEVNNNSSSNENRNTDYRTPVNSSDNGDNRQIPSDAGYIDVNPNPNADATTGENAANTSGYIEVTGADAAPGVTTNADGYVEVKPDVAPENAANTTGKSKVVNDNGDEQGGGGKKSKKNHKNKKNKHKKNKKKRTKKVKKVNKRKSK